MKSREKTIHYVYIVQCADNTLYTGWTTDLAARMEAHNSGSGAKYTRGRGPVSLIYCETYETMSDALKREHRIKKLSRAEKLKLISQDGTGISNVLITK